MAEEKIPDYLGKYKVNIQTTVIPPPAPDHVKLDFKIYALNCTGRSLVHSLLSVRI